MKIKVLNQIKENVKIPRWKLNSSMNIKCSCKSFLMQADVVIPGAYCILSTGRIFRLDLFYAGEKSDIPNTRFKCFMHVR